MRRSLLLVCCLVALSAGCRTASDGVLPRAYAVEGRTPRILAVDDEAAFPLTVVNTGTLAWDPARVHFSYHWRSLAGQVVQEEPGSPSPEDGIRTELGAPVPANGRLQIAGRLLAPPAPGLYWLQWDIVEEGVTWFSRVGPAEPGRLVAVLPTVSLLASFAKLASPLAAAVALAGLLALFWSERRGTRTGVLVSFALVADIVWAVTSVVCKQIVLANEVAIEPADTAWLLMCWVAVAPPLVIALAAPRRLRAALLFGFVTLCTVVLLADAVYYRFFGDVLSVPAVLAVGQTPQLTSSIRSLLVARLTWLLADVPVALWLVIRLRRTPLADAATGRARPMLAVIASVSAVVLLGATAAPVFASGQLDQMFRDRTVMEQFGPLGYHVYDAWVYARATSLHLPPSQSHVRQVTQWFAESAPGRSGGQSPLFGVARGKNLIIVQVESLQDFVVDYQVGGQYVMPHLRAWTADTFRFTDISDQTSEGRTSDAEFTTMTSLLPIDHGALAFRYPANHHVGLPGVLGERGYDTFSAVAFEPGFWNRDVVHPAYGFRHSFFQADFQPGERIGWGLNDRAFLQQMLPRLEQARAPFCSWLITLSLHHPYESFPAAHKELPLGGLEGTSFGNYLHAMHYVDLALDEFRSALARDGLLDQSVLVVFGDHDAGFPFEPASFRFLGIGDGDFPWMLADRIPLFVRVPGGARAGLARTVTVPGGQVDLAPTVLSLLGVDTSGLPYVGRDLLAPEVDRPIVRPYGDWVDRTHAMIAHGPPSSVRCIARDTGALVDIGVCAEADRRARAERDISRMIVGDDLQATIRADLAERAH